MKINFRGVCQLKYHHKFIIKEGEPFFYYELLVPCNLAWPDHYFYRALSASDNACIKKEVWPCKTRYHVGQKFGKVYRIAKLYFSKILQFNYYYQYFNVLAKLYFAKLIFLHFHQTFLSPNFCPIATCSVYTIIID